MSELGEYLKTKREEQNISMENLQDMTKIQKRYLTAIEEGRYDSLPGAFYTRAFVKSYAEALGLNPEEVFDAYGGELPQPRQQTTDLPSRAEKAKPKMEKGSRRKPAILPALLGILFLLVVAAGIYLVVQETDQGSSDGSAPDEEPAIEMDSNENTESNTETSTPESENDTDTTEDEADGNGENENGDEGDNTDSSDSNGEQNEQKQEDESEETVTPEFVETINGNRSVFDVSGAEKMIIEIEKTGNAWTAIEDEDGTSLKDISGMQPGDTREMDLSEEDYVRVNAGTSSNIIVRFNGEKVEFPLDKVHQYLIFDKNPE